MLKFKNAIFKILIEIFIFNKSRRKILKARWAKKHLKKYVDAAIKTVDPLKVAAEKRHDCKIIWQYWHQGAENAPQLVKECLASVKRFNPEYEVKLLTFETAGEYVELPQKYYDLVRQKKIKIAFFSDMLRLNLLRKYGGVWVDATILLTSPLPQNILDAEFMVMQKDVRSDLSENIMSCFFIRSVSNSLFLELIKTTLENYWQDNDFVINYFMFEHIATIIASYSEELASQWREMPFYNAEDAGLLQKMLCREFDETEFRKLNDITGIHKLTHKKSYDNASETSYYRHIVAGSTQSQGDEK